MADNVKIQLGLQGKTVQMIEELTDKTAAQNPADTISSSIQLVSELIEEIQKGAKIFIEKKDGTRQELKIKGIL